MNFAIALALAYIVCGIAQVADDFGKLRIDRPLWTLNPTIWKAAYVIVSWPIRPFINPTYRHRWDGRAVAYCTAIVCFQIALPGTMIYGCIRLAEHLFAGSLARLTTSTLFIGLGLVLVLPVMAILVSPLNLLVLSIIEVFFAKGRLAAMRDIAAGIFFGFIIRWIRPHGWALWAITFGSLSFITLGVIELVLISKETHRK